jgi:hypothetical protein
MPKVAILHPGIYGNLENTALTSSFLGDVTVVRYTAGMTKEDLLAAIPNPTGLTHVAFIYHHPGHSHLPFFPDDSDTQPRLSTTYRYFSDTVINILQAMKSTINDSLTVDILSCDLNEEAYKQEVQKIETDLGINIRYSVDKTGNSGANWVLESETPAVSVRPTYFTNGVLDWNGILTSNITADVKAGEYSDYIKWKASTKTFTVKMDFAWTELGLSDPDSYITLGNGETFDGANKVIDITGFLDWNGLLACNATAFATAPLIKNLGIINGKIGGVSGGGGAIVRSSQKFFKIQNCYSTGEINTSRAGGIVGEDAGAYSGQCYIDGCYSTGELTGGSVGGIVGRTAAQVNGKCEIINCYSLGGISGGGAGGIVGQFAGAVSGVCTVTNCYSLGDIGGGNAGIVGSQAGAFSGICDISGCYSAGNITPTGYGIAGPTTDPACSITNCICNGPSISDSGIITNCSTDLNDIDGTLGIYLNSANWQSGVLPLIGIKLPILKVFTVSPWDFTTYTKADDEAHFLYLPPPLPDNSFPLRVNPYLSIGNIQVYTTEFVRALVAGTVLPDPGLTPWSTDSLPAGTLLRPLGRSAVVNGANKLAIYRFENVQLINGPKSEGVPIGDTTGRWYTGWICTWSADGVAPAFF